MNFLPISPSNSATRRRWGSFTLVEMMTAIAVLSIMLLMLAQVLGLVSHAWTTGYRNVNNYTKSRAMLDLFASDIQSGVFRNDLGAFPYPATNIEFYTKRPGILTTTGTTVRNVSLVQYAYNNTSTTAATTMTTLERGDMAIQWNASPSQIPFSTSTSPVFGSNTTTARDTAPGVIDYKTLFVYADGSFSTNYPSTTSSPLRAISLTLAVVDDQSLQQMTASEVTQLRSALDGSVSGTRSVKADWETYLNTMNWTPYPKTTAADLKVFERYVPISGF